MNIEYKNQSNFANFYDKVQGKSIALMYDANTKPFALEMKDNLSKINCKVLDVYYKDEELIPSEDKCQYAEDIAKGTDYVLAVGSGTLNDMAKFIATRLGIQSGCLTTAASMDGYCSKGSALMRGGMKVTDSVNAPADILIDLDIVCNAPKIMTAAGFGDIIGKYTCLTDWQLANAVKGEEIHEQAFSLMQTALQKCVDAFEGLVTYDKTAVACLMDALITAGLSMEMCGNSRPASGSEHHQSHFLEVDFVRRGEKIPLHGVKVAIGTLVALELYNYLKDNKVEFNGAEKVYALVEKLPTIQSVKSMLEQMGCPTRFSQVGVREETMEEMIEKAYTMRDRYTILTLIHELGLTEEIKPIIMKKYF